MAGQRRCLIDNLNLLGRWLHHVKARLLFSVHSADQKEARGQFYSVLGREVVVWYWPNGTFSVYLPVCPLASVRDQLEAVAVQLGTRAELYAALAEEGKR